jgi:outer membrane cobalamin receptor
LREQWNDNALALFARGNYSYRFPALEDRYYTLVGAMGNPGLTPEKDLTGIAGFEGKSGLLQGSLEGYYQIRNNVQVPVTLSDGFTVQQQNLGQAKIASLIASGSAQATSQLKLSDSLSYNHSRVNTLQSAFPYMPSVVNTFGSEWAFVRHMIFSADVRAQSSSFVSNSSPHLPAVVFADVQLAYTFQGGIQVIGRAENISDSNLVLTQGYPSKGRVLALSVVGPL